MDNELKEYYAARLNMADDAEMRTVIFFTREELAIVAKNNRFPMGKIRVQDSREGTDATTMDPFYVWTCIVTKTYNAKTIFEQLDNFDFRQFCKNWNADEVQRVIEKREKGTFPHNFSASKNEKLIAAYFRSDKLISDVNEKELMGRMKQLMNYRTDKFVVELFNIFGPGDNFFKEDAWSIANHRAMARLEDWETRLIAEVELGGDDSDSDSDSNASL